MSKRRRRSRAGSGKHKARPSTPEVHFTAAEEEFFRTGESLHEMSAATIEEREPERPSLWRRVVARLSFAD